MKQNSFLWKNIIILLDILGQNPFLLKDSRLIDIRLKYI